MVTQTRKKKPSKTASKGAGKKSKTTPSTHKKSPSNTKVTSAKVTNKVGTKTVARKITDTKPKAKPVEPKRVTLKRTEPKFKNGNVMPDKFEPYQPLKDEPYMSDRQLQHFRNILEAWKKELKREVDNTITEMKDASVLADPNDRATEEEIFSLKLRTRDRERKLIHKIEEALQLIDDKEYGYCESCGIEIGTRRLEARPTAFLCIDCKTLDEIRERNMQ